MITITNMGYISIYAPIAIILCVVPKTRKRMGIPLVITLFMATELNNILKNLFKIERPDINRLIAAGGYGFPSGHTMVSTAFVGMLAYLLIKKVQIKWLKYCIAGLAAIFVVLVGFSRIYLGVHTTTDVLGGFTAGVCIFSGVVVTKMVDIRQNIKNNVV